MRIVVTGAQGFVGVNVAARLAAEGHTVVAVGRREPDAWVARVLADTAVRVEHRVADLAEPEALSRAVVGAVDTVVHAAVVTATTEAVERDEARGIVAVNVGGTVEALELARERGARRFVYVSSPSAIGPVEADGPIDETVVPRPTTLYGITKLASEAIVARHGALHGLACVSVRIAQPYGPGERATPSRPRTSPIWEWLEAARRGEPLVTGPLDRARDWTWIGETARGIATLATTEAVPHDLYHLGAGSLTTVAEVVAALREAFPDLVVDDNSGHPELNPNISGPSRPALDTRRFQDDFGWAPSRPFEEGMRDYLDWTLARG